MFRAFLLIYRKRSADLFRIATHGTGTLPDGAIHPDLTRRLAAEAAKAADRVLQMCIRAIDYCPPVDITFGDFLRGVITADLDYAPQDPSGYRIVFIHSFREWGIHPRGVSSMGQDALAWPTGDELMKDLFAADKAGELESQLREYMKNSEFLGLIGEWSLENDRFEMWRTLDDMRWKLWHWLRDGDSYGHDYASLVGLVIADREAPPTVYRNRHGEPAIEIHAVRPAVRPSLYGGSRTDLVVEITQRRRGYFDRNVQQEMDRRTDVLAQDEDGDFKYRAGCTILIDPATQEVRRVIRTAGTVAGDTELERVRRFLTGEAGTSGNAFDAGFPASLRAGRPAARDEPFALLHQDSED